MNYKKTIFIICTIFFIWTGKKVSGQITSDTFRYVTDSVQTWTVPGCVTQATIQLWGGGAGGGMYYCYYYYYWYYDYGEVGASGAYYQGVLSGLTAGTVLDLSVPSGGQYGNDGVCAYYGAGGVGGWPGGGNGGEDGYYEEYGGGGGGYAAVEVGGVYYVVTGAGGGGGGYPYFFSSGGGGGATTGGSGGSFFGPYDGGSGGTLSAGGSPYYNYYACDASPTEDGSAFQGGYGGGHASCYTYYYGGGGGGGGYYGGGGGGDDGGGGGGGSSFPTSSYSSNGITFTVSADSEGTQWGYRDNFAPGPPPDTSIGMGGLAQNGGNGMIIITYWGGAPLLTSSISSQKNPTCGLCNGRLSVSASGGGGPYTYFWSPGGQTGDTATGLCAGSYEVIVNDSCGDMDTASALIVATPISVSDSVTGQDKCNANCIGSIVSSVSLGTSPYTYLWMPGSESSATASSLCAGAYTITITDKNGCTGTATATITQPSAIVLSDTVTNVKCYGGTGTATVTATGGYSPYSYYWNPLGETTSVATGLSAGTYTVTITDSGGCTATITAALTQPVLLTATVSAHSNVACYGGTGGATATASGGVSPYTYLWNPGAQATATATGLSAGGYTVTISDNNGCTATANITITQPGLLTATMGNPINALCYAGTGSATVTAGGGTIPYAYLWTPTAQATATATGLTAGAYSVTITDGNGCTTTSTVTITQPTLLTANISSTNNALCYGDTGNATVTPAGGTAPYTYFWSPGRQSNALATGLSAGGYTVTVTDNNACTATAIATITQPTQLTDTISAYNDVLCYGGTGNATVTARGGTSPYTYLWNPTRQITAAATGLSMGTYSVTVNDHNGCSASTMVNITQPALLTATMGTPNKIRCNGGTGSVTVNAAGGSIPYTYLWTPSAQATALATGLAAGSYAVTITDHNHCSASATVTMTQPSAVTATILSDTSISCNNGNNGTATVKGGGGIRPYTYLWTPSGNTNAHATGLFAVSYTVTVTDSNGCTATTTTTLSQPAQLTVSVSEPRIVCKDSTGNLLANTNGGTAPYKYSWSTGVISTNNTVSITPVSTIYYSVTVTDVNGCSATGDITIHFGPSFAVNISGKNSVCAGDSTTICANAIDPMYGATYLWAPQNSTNACFPVTPLSTSVYSVTVIDGCGATTTASTTVSTEPIPKVEMYADFYQGCKPLCIQFRNASTLAQGSIQQYIWNFGLALGESDTSRQQSPVYCYKSGGEYNVTLTVVSDIGCTAALEKINMIDVYDPPKAAFTYSPQPTTIENPTIRFTDESGNTNQAGIIYRLWKFGDESDSTSNLANPSHTYSDTGTYCATLIVMNGGGCTDTITNCLVIGPAFKLYIPSAFTPNGDELNETFKPVGQYVKNFEMYVFNRWGMQLYHTTDITKGWDGTMDGQPVQEDTYIYKVTVTDSQDNEHSYVGNVILLK